ncbi:MFS transporter [Hyphococcus sp.]|uniref:MFS transporter n=1 Tax=Hyphococcus sp. TaxID=2038636 RepID=UPI003CCB8300
MTSRLQPSATRLDSPAALAAILLPATVGVMTPFLSPITVGGLVDVAGWSEKEAGLLIAAEMNAFAWSGLAGIIWLNRVPWRVVSLVACFLFVFANIASCISSNDALVLWRVLSGVGAGTLIALCYGALAQSAKPHRNYAFFSMSQMALAMACLTVLPVAIRLNESAESSIASILRTLGVSDGLGMNAYFGALAVLGGVAMMAAFWAPRRPERPPEAAAAISSERNIVKIIITLAMLAAIFTLMASHQSIWTYAERLGASAGIKPASLGLALSFGTLAGFIGAFSAAAVSTRINRPLVIAVIFGLHILALLILLTNLNKTGFVIAILLHKFAWNFMIPYQLGMMAEIDRGGRAAILSTFITSMGISAGAAVAAYAVSGFGYAGVIFASMLLAVGYFLIMQILDARLRPANPLHSLFYRRKEQQA